MLAGGGVFGVVDHLWNGELFLVGANRLWDLALGVAITLAIVAAWAVAAFRIPSVEGVAAKIRE